MVLLVLLVIFGFQAILGMLFVLFLCGHNSGTLGLNCLLDFVRHIALVGWCLVLLWQRCCRRLHKIKVESQASCQIVHQ